MSAPLVVAHRGDSHRFPENTLAAFAAAVDAGADVIELDVQTTADGVSLVLHDPTLLRIFGVPQAVRSCTAAEIAELSAGQVPTLVQALDAMRGTGVAILVDVYDPYDVDAAAAVLVDGWPEVQTLWCGTVPAMTRVRELLPDAVLQLELEQPWGAVGPSEREPVAERIESLNAAWLNAEGILLTPELVAWCAERGIKVATWTLDDARHMAAALALGVDSITTNRPGLLRQVIDQEPERSGPYDRELGVARGLGAWAAGYSRWTSPGSTVTKAHAADLLTDVDLAVEAQTRAVLGRLCPDHAIVGEEQGGQPVSGVPTWCIDPVDGTTNFASGLPWTSYSLGLAIDTTPILGVVADPWRGEVLSGQRGGGVFCDGLRVRASDANSLAGGVLLTEWAAHSSWPGMPALLAALAQRHVTTRIMGSGTLTVASVAAGRCLAAVINRYSPIDHLAGVALALEAGAVVLTAAGRVEWPGDGPFAVAAPGVADEIEELMQAVWSEHS